MYHQIDLIVGRDYGGVIVLPTIAAGARLVVINGHGGNVGPIGKVTQDIYRDSKIVIPSLYLWRISYGLLPKFLGAEKAAKASGHGADPLTSLAMHLFPERVRADMIPEARPLKRAEGLDLPFTTLGAASFEGAEIDLPHEYDEVYTLGVAKGDPRLCSAETGKALTEDLTDICARFIAHFAARTPA